MISSQLPDLESESFKKLVIITSFFCVHTNMEGTE